MAEPASEEAQRGAVKAEGSSSASPNPKEENSNSRAMAETQQAEAAVLEETIPADQSKQSTETKAETTTTQTNEDEDANMATDDENEASTAKEDVASPAYTRSKRKRMQDEAAAAAAAKDGHTAENAGERNKRVKTQHTQDEASAATATTQKHEQHAAAPFGSTAEHNNNHNDGSGVPPQSSTTSVAAATASTTVPKKSPEADHYAETYLELANRMVFTMDPSTKQMLRDLDLPGGALSGLGYLKAGAAAGLRRPSILETWSPYEIAMFQAALAQYGKQFEKCQKEIGTKTVQQVIDFYYGVFKKTVHYQRWKKEYLQPHLDVDSEDEK